MYCPLLRSKQFELLALREISALTNLPYHKNFKPIIEPVNEDLSGLKKAVETLNEAKIIPLIIINPKVGEYKNHSPEALLSLINDLKISFDICFRISDPSFNEISHTIQNLNKPYSLFIESGIGNNILPLADKAQYNIISEHTHPNILNPMKNKILFNDFFEIEDRNADYKSESEFSHLHTTFKSHQNCLGFGDYSIVGAKYTESGGPAHVVTLHFPYIDYQRNDNLFVRHYLSSNDGTPTNPGGKFLEALEQLIQEQDNLKIFLESKGLALFRQYYKDEHYPNLGKAKQLSMMHHIETVCDYLSNNP